MQISLTGSIEWNILVTALKYPSSPSEHTLSQQTTLKMMKMKSIACVIAALLCVRTAASDSSVICELKEVPGNSNDWITLKEMPLGCWTDFTTRDDEREVHILNLLFTDDLTKFFSLNITALNPSVLIIRSTATHTFQVLLQNNPAVKIEVTNGTLIQFMASQSPVIEVPSADTDSELLKWATEKYGGVTSFTTARHPGSIIYTGMTGALFQRPSTCDLETPADKHFIKLDVFERPDELRSDELQSCYMKHPGEQLHVINIPDDVKIRHVSVHLSSGSKLFLRGPPNTEWEIHANHNIHNIKFVSNNNITWKNLTLSPRAGVVSDDAGDIRQKVMSYYTNAFISSYSEIRLNASHIQLWITDNTSSSGAAEVELTRPTPTSSSSSSATAYEMVLFLSPDFKSPLDSCSKVHSDKRVYAEISHPVIEGIPFRIKVSRCWVRSMPVLRDISLKEESCFGDCPNKLRFSFEMLQDLPPGSWDLECAVQLCYTVEVCINEAQVKRNFQVKPYIPNPNPHFEFGLSAVLGIAFGGFLIGVLLTGALWFIKIRTAYEGRAGESRSNKPRDDSPL